MLHVSAQSEYFYHHCVSCHHHHHHHVVVVCSTYYSYSYSRDWTFFYVATNWTEKRNKISSFPSISEIEHPSALRKKKRKKHKSNLIHSDLMTRGSRITFGMVEMFHYRMAFGPYRPDIWHLECNLSGLQLKMFIVSQPWPLYHPLPLSQGAAGAYHFYFFLFQTCSKLRRNDSFRAHFLCDGIFNSLKCQVSSFHPALSLLSFAERTACSGMCLRGLLSLFSSSRILGPVPRVMIYGKMLCASSKAGFAVSFG